MPYVYPLRLLPKKNYKYINEDSLVGKDQYLIRFTPNKENINELGHIKDKEICPQRSHLVGLSINLLGYFKVKDNYYGVSDEKLRADWKKGKAGIRPTINQFFINNDRGYFILPFNIFHNYPHPVEDKHLKEKLKYTAKLEHKPILANFWHFEVHWYNDEGIKVIRDEKKVRGAPNRILTELRNIIKYYGMMNKHKNVKILPKKCFVKKSI